MRCGNESKRRKGGLKLLLRSRVWVRKLIQGWSDGGLETGNKIGENLTKSTHIEKRGCSGTQGTPSLTQCDRVSKISF